MESQSDEQPMTSSPGEAPVGRAERRRGSKAGADGIHHTRIGGAWVAVAVAVVLGVALIDFIVQNTRSVRVEFFGAHGQMPVAVALLGAALAGAFLVLAVGIARTTQLRIATRRGKKREEHAASVAADTEG
jgi:uncharacterized integral membrane protein